LYFFNTLSNNIFTTPFKAYVFVSWIYLGAIREQGQSSTRTNVIKIHEGVEAGGVLLPPAASVLEGASSPLTCRPALGAVKPLPRVRRRSGTSLPRCILLLFPTASQTRTKL